jgi:glycosyltransferase involved in cell wall biosynthesis
MRVAYVCADFGIPVRGYKGASVHVREMVAALQAQGHEVIVLSPNLGEGNDVAAGTCLRSVDLDALSRTAWRVGRALARAPESRLPNELRELAYNGTLLRRCAGLLLRELRPDVVYERYSLMNLAGLLVARLAGVPHLLEVNAPLRLERARTKGLALPAAASRVEAFLFRGTDAVVTVSRALRDYVIERGGRPERTIVQPNGVDTQRFHPDRDGAGVRERLGIAADASVIGFCGSLKPWHGTDVLLQAFAMLRARHSGARLLIVGEGPEGPSLRVQSARLGVESDVLFTDRMPHERMADFVCAMDVAAAPYRHVPNFYFSPLKLYEYMACGRAVVASGAGEIPELVRDGETGLLCACDDPAALAEALARLLESAGLRNRLGQAARAEALRHSWRSNASRVERLVRDFGSRRQRPSASARQVA